MEMTQGFIGVGRGLGLRGDDFKALFFLVEYLNRRASQDFTTLENPKP